MSTVRPHQPAPNGKRELIFNDVAKGDSPLDTWRRQHMGHGTYRWVRE